MAASSQPPACLVKLVELGQPLDDHLGGLQALPAAALALAADRVLQERRGVDLGLVRLRRDVRGVGLHQHQVLGVDRALLAQHHHDLLKRLDRLPVVGEVPVHAGLLVGLLLLHTGLVLRQALQLAAEEGELVIQRRDGTLRPVDLGRRLVHSRADLDAILRVLGICFRAPLVEVHLLVGLVAQRRHQRLDHAGHLVEGARGGVAVLLLDHGDLLLHLHGHLHGLGGSRLLLLLHGRLVGDRAGILGLLVVGAPQGCAHLVRELRGAGAGLRLHLQETGRLLRHLQHLLAAEVLQVLRQEQHGVHALQELRRHLDEVDQLEAELVLLLGGHGHELALVLHHLQRLLVAHEDPLRHGLGPVSLGGLLELVGEDRLLLTEASLELLHLLLLDPQEVDELLLLIVEAPLGLLPGLGETQL